MGALSIQAPGVYFPTPLDPLRAELVPNHKYRHGLIAAIAPHTLNRVYNFADGCWYGNQNAGNAAANTRDGRRLNYGFLSEQPGGSTTCLLRRPQVTNQITIFVVANLAGNAGASKSCFFGVWPKSTDAAPWSGYAMTQDDWLLNFWHNNGGTEGNAAVDCNLDQSTYHNRILTLAITAKSGAQRFFRDASLRGTGTATWTALGASFGSDWCFGIGRAPRGDQTNTNAIHLALAWDHVKQDADIAWLHARAREMFRAKGLQRRAYAAAAGGTTFEDSLTEAVTPTAAEAVLLTARPALAEAVTLVATPAARAQIAASLAESVTPGAVQTMAWRGRGFLAEAVTPGDAVAARVRAAAAIAEGVNPGDALDDGPDAPSAGDDWIIRTRRRRRGGR